MNFKQPILLVTFNRPDTTKKVLEAIARVKPLKLYVFSDAPREGNQNDEIKVNEVRDIFKDLPWEVDLKTNFQRTNLGCAKGVSTAINWIFEQEEQAIILEDDCLPNDSFFIFCDEMLNKYANENKIMHISGTRWNPEFKINESYLFSSIGHVWGWATWKRAWAKYDYNMLNWEDQIIKIKADLKKPIYIGFWEELFDSISKSKNKHTWDYQWQYTLFKEEGLAIVPDVNLIINIGTMGTHAISKKKFKEINSYTYNTLLVDWHLKKHPIEIKQNEAYDLYHMKNHFFRFAGTLNKLKKFIKYYVKG